MTEKKIIVAYDGSDDSKKAVDMAISLAADMPAKVIFISVFDVPAALANEGKYAVFVKDFEEACRRKLTAIQAYCNEHNVDTEFDIIQGNPADEIIKYAHDQQAYMIITGTRGLGGFKRLLLGSVAHKLVTYSDIPVMVVK